MKRFFKFTLPSVFSMWVYALYTMVDGYFVANFAGEAEFSAINISMPAVTTLFAFGMLFSIGTQAKAAFNLGRRNYSKANEIFTSGFVGLVLCGGIYTLLLRLFIDPLSVLLGAGELTSEHVRSYLGIVIPFGVFFMTTYQLEVLVKADGFPQLSALSVFSAALTNIALDYLFVAHLGMGVFGAGLATGIAQIVSTVLLLTHFARKKGRLRFVRRVDLRRLKVLLPIGMGDAVAELSVGYTVFLFNRTLSDIMGPNGVVLYTVISYISVFVQVTMAGIAQGLAPLFSYDFGRGNFKRVRDCFAGGMISIALVGAVFSAAANFCSGPVIGLFLESGSGIHAAAQGAFARYSAAFVFLGMNILMISFFASMGKGMLSISVSLLRTPICISAVMLIYRHFIGGQFIWYVLAVSEAITLCAAAVMLVTRVIIPMKARKKMEEEL